MYWPRFEDSLLEDIAFSLRKRRKTLKHSTDGIRCERLVEIEDSETTEKMELEVRLTNKTSVRVFAWSDRWLWVDARASAKKGWAWEWTRDGRLLGGCGGKDVVGAIENTLSKTHFVDSQQTDVFTEIWKRLLARGPEEVRFR